MRFITLLPTVLLTFASAFGESLAIPTVMESHGPSPQLVAAANRLREAGTLLSFEQIATQLERPTCELVLPQKREQKLAGREIWEAARKSHVRIGYLYLCPRCENWHLNLAGGYAITPDGAVATCYHVVGNKEDMRQGFIVAVTHDDRILPVTEVLAGNKLNDVCIVRVKSDTLLTPLPLNPQAQPGDDAWCYSDPLGHPGFFSKGIVNRYFQRVPAGNSTEKFPRRMNVSTDWAPGSSGAAVLDECANAIGHVSEISAQGKQRKAGKDSSGGETLIVFHNAACAADVISLVKPTKADSK